MYQEFMWIYLKTSDSYSIYDAPSLSRAELKEWGETFKKSSDEKKIYTEFKIITSWQLSGPMWTKRRKVDTGF